MISYKSCAELEAILNQAAILAAYHHRDRVSMRDLIEVVLKSQYNILDGEEPSEEEQRKDAFHEAGHVVVCEALLPGGVGLASLQERALDGCGGFIHRCLSYDKPEQHILVALAGKAA